MINEAILEKIFEKSGVSLHKRQQTIMTNYDTMYISHNGSSHLGIGISAGCVEVYLNLPYTFPIYKKDIPKEFKVSLSNPNSLDMAAEAVREKWTWVQDIIEGG